MSPGGDPLRLGIAGCGRIVERGYLPALRATPGLRLSALADPDPERLRLCGKLWEESGGSAPASFSAPTALLESQSVDAIVVATPASDHAAVAAQATVAGVPALVEKPPAPDLAGAVALATLDPAPAIGFNRRFLQGAELAPSIPAKGWLELSLEMRFRRSGWGAHVCRDDALLDAGVHLIDLAAFLSGSAPIAVRRATVSAERAELELELGRARAHIACATDRGYAERVEVRGGGGRAIAASRTGRLRASLGRLAGAEDPLVGSLRRQLERFAAHVRGEAADELADPAAAVAAMSAIEAARRSARLGGAEVTVP